MKKLFISLVFVFLAVNVSFGQGVFLDKGVSGFGIGAGFGTNEDVTSFGGSVGYSFNGIFDIGLDINRFSFDQKLLGDDLSAITISPSVAFHALKQNENIPVSISLGAGYDYQKYSNDALDALNIDMTGGFFSIGASIFGYFKVAPSMKIQPALGVTYVTGEMKLEDDAGNSETSDDNTTVFGLGISLVFVISHKNVLAITPRINFTEDNTSFVLNFSFILPTN